MGKGKDTKLEKREGGRRGKGKNGKGGKTLSFDKILEMSVCKHCICCMTVKIHQKNILEL